MERTTWHFWVSEWPVNSRVPFFDLIFLLLWTLCYIFGRNFDFHDLLPLPVTPRAHLPLVPLDRNTVSFLFTDTSPKWLPAVWSCRYSAFFVYPLSRPAALQGGGGAWGALVPPPPLVRGIPMFPHWPPWKQKLTGQAKSWQIPQIMNLLAWGACDSKIDGRADQPTDRQEGGMAWRRVEGRGYFTYHFSSLIMFLSTG